MSSSRDECYAIPDMMDRLDSFFNLPDHPKNPPKPPQITDFVIFGQILQKIGLKVKNKQQWGFQERNGGLEQVEHELIFFFILLQYANEIFVNFELDG